MNVLKRLILVTIVSFIFLVAFNCLIINPALAINISAGFGTGTMIATPKVDVAIENLQPGDRVIGYNFETHRREENIVKGIKQKSSLSYFLINKKTKVTGTNLIYIKTLIAPELVRLHKIKIGNKLFSRQGSTVINSIEQIIKPINVYQIVLTNREGNVYADNILIHSGFELQPYFRNQHVDCKPGTPYYKQCANINSKTLPRFIAALGILAVSLTTVEKIIEKLFSYKSGAS